ncbi:hypothetical protein [Thalassospira mesophila]|uniref:hypothetical protein n=1 Tax=Thalassospira mesophila TaxID=1293891 RepID=UPI000A1EC27C|nr:hypothetical protein [Thalassospira mesophila]
MTKTAFLRSWATQLTIGAFLLMAGTGLMLFFEFEDGLTAVVHQWLSWFFLIGAGAHIFVNFKPFKSRLKSRWGVAFTTIFAAVFVLSCFSWGMITGPQLERPIEEALVFAPLSALAAVTKNQPDVIIAKLAGQGIVATPEQSIYDVVKKTGIDENILLGIIFLPGGETLAAK